MLKVKSNCPICGEIIGIKLLKSHLENIHELTGTVTLRLNPTHPYAHEAEEAEAGVSVEPAPEETPSLDELEAR